ncbi:hypothetical protein E1263_05775 [Kribbella antibiotica]|uniref:YfhO family protein n=1 Tax=Kribbella antibiotica TaxID=190195 RepID=A0A4R4ZU70_9ACTN|nr:YfhO family protein [Kribbella antibiotica]TDD61896.1 hypothetical protein E1263_05775 [Kribbella antibiotica]
MSALLFRFRSHWPSLLAGVASAAMFVAAGIVRGTFPFGERTRNVYDLGNQFIPMAAYLRDVVTGRGNGDLIFNWQSGFGTPFVGDFMAYVGSSLSWIALILPRAQIDLALYLIAVAAMGLAAGAMTAYLRMLRPSGPVWVAITAGASYGACAWAVGEGAYMTLWLSGLIAFPLICLLCEWTLQRRSVLATVVTPLVVALLWTSHFYTVYMATIAAGIVTLARVLAGEEAWRWRLTGGLRCALAVALGIGLTAPLLIPTFPLVKAATPSPDREFHPLGAEQFLARLLSGTSGLGYAPALTVGTLMLLLALTFPLNRRIPLRQRVVWTVLVVLTASTLQIPFTHRVWHGFDTPDGNAFRQAFVIAGMLVILGWLSASAGLGSVVTLVLPMALMLGLVTWTWDIEYSTPVTHVAVPILLCLAGLAWLVTQRRVPRWLRRGTVAVLIGAVLVEGTLTAAVLDRTNLLGRTRPWGVEHAVARELVESVNDWPRHRTAPGALTTQNDPMLIGGQGPQHYSSTIPYRTTQVLEALGFGYAAYGRALEDPENPVVDAIFAIHARVGRGPVLVKNANVAPLVTLRPAKLWQSPDPGPFGAQETALGADVYTMTKLVHSNGSTASVSIRDGVVRMLPPADRRGPSEVHLVTHCRPGSYAYLVAPDFPGNALVDGVWRPISGGKRPGIYSGAAMRRVGTADANGLVRVTLQLTEPGRLPSDTVGCLDRGRLESAVAGLTAATDIRVSGHKLTAHLPSGPAATAVVGVVGIDGWVCSVDGSPAELRSDAAGLVAVPIRAGASELACSYQLPGGRTGLAVGAGAVLGLLLLIALVAWRRRPRSGDELGEFSEGVDGVAGPGGVAVGMLKGTDRVHA